MIGIVSFSEKGRKLQEHIAKSFDEVIICEEKDRKAWVKNIFNQVDSIIFVGAVGIAVRYIAPLIKSKMEDPAIVVVDELGMYAIPILSGHVGGANKLALKLEEKIGTKPIITTATDINNVFAIDNYAVEQNYVILNPENIKHVSSSLLKNQDVGFFTDIKNIQKPEVLKEGTDFKVGVCISYDEKNKPYEHTLNLIPKNIILGTGCRKNIDSKVYEDFVLEKLKEHKISVKAVKSIGSIDIKKDEKCIIDFAEKYKIPFITYSSEELQKVKGDFPKSEYVKTVTGVDNVCSRACILSGGQHRISDKLSGNGITLTIGKEE